MLSFAIFVWAAIVVVVVVVVAVYLCICHVPTVYTYSVRARVCVCTYSGRPFAHNVLFGFCTCILCAVAAALLFMAFNPIPPPPTTPANCFRM